MAITRSCRGVVKFLRAPWDRRKMQKIVAYYFPFSHHGDVTVSLRRLWRFYGVPTECYCLHAEFQLALDCALTACSRRAHGVLGAATARARRARGVRSARAASVINFVFKTARRYLRKRHSRSDSGGVTNTFAIRFITLSIAMDGRKEQETEGGQKQRERDASQ